MPQRGKFVIFLILGVGLSAAIVAWWFHYKQGRHILQLWGAETAYLIRMAPECELLRLAPSKSGSATSADPLRIDGQLWHVVSASDISDARGLVHARQALIEDASYDWSDAPRIPRPNWSHALRFSDDRQQTVLIFDLSQKVVRNLNVDRQGNIAPIADGLRLFFDEQIASP